MDVPRTFEIRDAGSQNYCNCNILNLELLHNGLPLDFRQFLCLTERSLTLTHNTKLLRADCDGMVTFTTPGVEGPILLALCEIEYLREDTPKPPPAVPSRSTKGRRAMAMVAASAIGACLLVLAIFLHTHR